MNTYATLPADLPRPRSDAEELPDGKFWRKVSNVFLQPTPCPATVFGTCRKNVRGSFAGI